MASYNITLEESMGMLDSMPGLESLPERVGIPIARVYKPYTNFTVGPEDIIEARIKSETGKITEWRVALDNTDGKFDNKFEVGDEIEISLGYGDDVRVATRGLLYNIDSLEGVLLLEGFDWLDYLTGPIVDKEYYDVDWGDVVKDLILSYAPALDVSEITPIGSTTGGLLTLRNVPLWEALLDVQIKTNRTIIITPDRKVRFVPYSEAYYGIRDEYVLRVNLRRDRGTMVNKLILVGEKERIIDSFMETSLRDEVWEVLSGTWTPTPELDLKHTGNVEGRLITKITSYAQEITAPVKQSTQPYEVSYHARCNNELTEGYRLRLWHDGTNYRLTLYREPNDVQLADYVLSSQEISLIQSLKYIKVGFVLRGPILEGYLEGVKRLSAEDYTWEAGKVCFRAPANRDTYFDSITIFTDTPIYAIVEDSSLINKFGEKVLIVRKPEVSLRTEAERLAALELDKRRYEATRGVLELDGTLELKSGDKIKLWLREPYLFGLEYEIIGVEQIFAEEDWTTRLTLVETSPYLEEVLRYLAKESIKRMVEIALPKQISALDQIVDIPSEEIIVYLERNSLGNARIGESMRVSSFGGS